MAVITVVGAGMMGSALCVPLADRGHEVRLVGTPFDRHLIARILEDGHHLGLRQALPRELRAFQVDELATALDGADAVALGVSSAGVRWAGQAVGPLLRPGMPLFSITKGLEWDGERLRVLPDVLAAELPASLRETVAPAAIAGPCIAGELARRVPTCVVLTGRNRASLETIAGLVRTSYYRVFLSDDLEGVEICAALKNAFAMGVAFGAGLHERHGGVPGSIAMHNYESAVMAQAIGEMMRVIEVTGLGLSLPDAVARMDGATLECLEILAVMRTAMTALKERGVLGAKELPLLHEMTRVALDGASLEMPFDAFFGGEHG